MIFFTVGVIVWGVEGEGDELGTQGDLTELGVWIGDSNILAIHRCSLIADSLKRAPSVTVGSLLLGKHLSRGTLSGEVDDGLKQWIFKTQCFFLEMRIKHLHRVACLEWPNLNLISFRYLNSVRPQSNGLGYFEFRVFLLLLMVHSALGRPSTPPLGSNVISNDGRVLLPRASTEVSWITLLRLESL